MTRLDDWISVAGLSAALLLAPGLASSAPVRHAAPCCRLAAGTLVEIELADPVSTKTQKTGDTFAIKLAEPLVARGRLIAPAGTTGVGEVIQATRPGLGGKAAKLVLAARYLTIGDKQAPLRNLRLVASGKNNSGAAGIVGLSGIAFAPLGFVGLAVRGGDAAIPAGQQATARLARATTLASIGPAPRLLASNAVSSPAPAADAAADLIPIPPPPAGKGQVVFFRKRSILSTGQWFKVREKGAAIGKLANGAYFIHTTAPGTHTYTATFEPEMRDHLTLEIGPGDTYFVEGAVSKALVLGAADLSPSDRDTFEMAARRLRLAGQPSKSSEDEDAPRAHSTQSASAN
jgi:hypothetical protein